MLLLIVTTPIYENFRLSNCVSSVTLNLSVFFAMSMLLFLGVEKFQGSHSAEAIASKILEIMKSFGIEKKVRHITSDSASNMIRGLYSNF